MSLTALNTKAAPKGAAVSKQDFIGKTGTPKTLVIPRRQRATKASQVRDMCIKLMFFGGWSTGKTYAILDLLLMGYKIVYVSTDLGGDGTMGVRLALNRMGRQDLLDNLYIIVLDGQKEVKDFIKEPAAFCEDIYDFDPDFLVWDGFSLYQNNDLMASVGESIATEAAMSGNLAKLSDSRAAGNKFETQDWQVIRNETLKVIDAFCALHNKKTGKVWHKIITALEKVASKPGGGGLIEQKSPFVSGAGGFFMGGAFDLIIRTVARTDKDGEVGDRIYEYVIAGNQTNSVKNRGFILPPVMNASMRALWTEITTQLGIEMGAVSEGLKGEVLVANDQSEEGATQE